MKKQECWSPKHPRTAAEYSRACYWLREERRTRLNTAILFLLAFSLGFFLGTLTVRVAIQMVI